MVRIALDMMGGDFAPLQAVKGVVAYLKDLDNPAHLLLLGPQEQLQVLLNEHQIDPQHYTIVDAPEIIGMHEHPTKALKEKPRSSIAIGFHMLAGGNADALISAGNTGAMMVGALFSIKTIEGVMRPTIGGYMPREDGSLGLLLDVGLNADCKPEHLNQFAVLGSLYAEHILKVESPKTGLVNLGAEEGKGNLLAQATYPLLKENKHINFIGNIEGRDILVSGADVMVCEGFTGNVVLKLAESIYDIVERRQISDEHFDRFNFEVYGGVPVLGVAKPVIIGHGISGESAFKKMITTAQKMVDIDLSSKIKAAFVS